MAAVSMHDATKIETHSSCDGRYTYSLRTIITSVKLNQSLNYLTFLNSRIKVRLLNLNVIIRGSYSFPVDNGGSDVFNALLGQLECIVVLETWIPTVDLVPSAIRC